jgi:hypothetical protein
MALALAGGSWAAPASLPAGTPGSAEARRDKVVKLTKRSIELLTAGKRDEAEAVLAEALALAPHSTINLYNMACLKALKGSSDAAMDYLERSVLAGYTDFIHIEQDTDLNTLRELPRFKKFLARKEEFLKLAAQRMEEALKGQFGEGYLVEVDEADKLIFATNTDPATLAALKKSLVMQAKSQWKDLFEHHPEQYISVIVPSPMDYRKLVEMRGVGGVYNHEMRALVAQHLGHVMTHEFTHAMHSADLDPLGQEHPTWISEGLATMYEGARFEGENLVPHESYRLRSIQYAGHDNRLIPLERLFKMDQATFTRNATLAYGESGNVMLYMHDQGILRKFYEAYKKGFDQEKSGKAAIELASGKPLAQFEKDWKAWMLKETPPPLNTGAQGVVMGVKFSEWIDGLKVMEVVPDSPAARAGLQVGDVLVGIDNQEIRDEEALMPMLSAHRAGEQVTAKLRRGTEYKAFSVTLGRRGDVTRGIISPATRPSSRK